MKAEITEYKGHNILVLPMGEKGKPFCFGIKKAQTILEYLDDVKAFVAQNEGGTVPPAKKPPF